MGAGGGGGLKKHPKNLDPSHRRDADFGIVFGGVDTII